MDLITNLLVWLATAIAAVLTNILAHDVCVSANRVCSNIIRRAAKHLAKFDQEDVETEWLGQLSEHDTVYEKYRHAIGCYIAAPRMRRRAQKVTLAINLRATGIGTVPLTLTFGNGAMYFAFAVGANEKTPAWIRKWVAAATVLHIFAKLLLSADCLGPGSVHNFLQKLKSNEFKTWQYEARITRKGLDMDLSTIFTFMVRNPSQIEPTLNRLADILAPQQQQADTAKKSPV